MLSSLASMEKNIKTSQKIRTGGRNTVQVFRLMLPSFYPQHYIGITSNPGILSTAGPDGHSHFRHPRADLCTEPTVNLTKYSIAWKIHPSKNFLNVIYQ